ncbi:cobalamin biosynthesis protein CobD [Sneathiella sp. P13V-1]|uniref:adenosylcobinamide-phosphate synthase CbiB n=1 Tax=Sneathiella sp. P13V-1 TaxID=2697366 RepID=UPI00187B76B1|nr:adenosylcobinamide-phosphate synthase CbiB [Sneathiella sp. P13V-1]MBE7638135.1 cobalamin biosynthesis protein CobD [Sneathiella sp. P13V-1]
MPETLHQIAQILRDPATLAGCVLLVDLLIGDPAFVYARISHPVVIIGNLISFFEKLLNRGGNILRFMTGSLTTLSVILISVIAGVMIMALIERIPFGFVLEILLASSLIACRGLYDAVRAVQKGLDVSLDKGRAAVSQIVGRDPESLDESGVTRAAIESLAENFSDGTVAPIFWFALFGLPGLIGYKAINTLDSMIGHRNDRYEYFGKFAARLDDAANYIPARLTGLLIAVAAVLLPGASSRRAFSCLVTDASGHKSVNAGWQEAAVAGALGISLAGPRIYGGKLTNDIWMNEAGVKDVGAAHLGRALSLYRLSVLLLVGVLAVIAWLQIS